LNSDATIFCQHSGQASPTTPSSRVQVSGSPVVTIAALYKVTGCSLQVQCASARWLMGALRVLSEGQFVVIANGISVCIPTGTPLVPQTVQPRVLAT
jgi:hypothetical protein